MWIRLSAAAREDLKSILREGLRRFGETAAFRYNEDLKRLLHLIGETPFMARERDEFEPPIRVHPFRSHIIIYQIEEDHVLVLRIRHGHEDWTSELEA